MKSNRNISIFSKNLLKFRKERGISQKALSEKTGISQRMIVYYENKCTSPPLDKAKAIAEALQISINDLLGTEDKLDDLFINIINYLTVNR